jgi:hypothetical protein
MVIGSNTEVAAQKATHWCLCNIAQKTQQLTTIYTQ